MQPQWLIEKKRDGHALDPDAIRFLVRGYAAGDIPDYQMAALAMAVYFRGMTLEETVVLTDSMMRTGAVLEFPELDRPTADKHSTGGIGDKVSLILAPLAACCGVAVPMISGRGLGITGGTLDKLESIPGYRTDLTIPEFREVLQTCGCSIIGQTAELAPADRKLYALRDVTGTVPSIPLIAASILSKKLAEGAGALVLDVKCGKGAFMKTVEQARELARTMVTIGSRLGRRMVAVLTDMNQPLGRSAGNSVEVAEGLAALRGQGPADLMDVTLTLTAHMLLLTGKARHEDQARALLQEALRSGAALRKFEQMVRLHGGRLDAFPASGHMPAARHSVACPAPRGGTVREVDAEGIGRACVVLGAGRRRVQDPVDHEVGVTGLVKRGEHVERGRPLFTLHANDSARLDEARNLAAQAVQIGDDPVKAKPLIIETIEGEVKETL